MGQLAKVAGGSDVMYHPLVSVRLSAHLKHSAANGFITGAHPAARHGAPAKHVGVIQPPCCTTCA
jgi:hypothetical protein